MAITATVRFADMLYESSRDPKKTRLALGLFLPNRCRKLICAIYGPPPQHTEAPTDRRPDRSGAVRAQDLPALFHESVSAQNSANQDRRSVRTHFLRHAQMQSRLHLLHAERTRRF